jgi:predicted nucleic acid-binding protein
MPLLYLDSSALVKLVAPEPETAALLSLLDSRPEVASSALARVEVLRAVARAGSGKRTRERARQVLSSVVRVDIDDPILEAAAALDPPGLRSLDAIHIATALALQPELEAVVSYDGRLNVAATALGLAVVTPRYAR